MHGRDDAILRLAARDGTRLAMRGNSMLPLFRDGMVLEVGAYNGAARVGDVVVFRQKERLVAHRVVALCGAGVTTSGDAQPQVVEDVKHSEILAVVTGVRAGDAPDAPRLDGTPFALRGRFYARAHRARAWLGRAAQIAAATRLFAFPWQRPRIQPALVDALAAIVRSDDAALATAIASVPADRFVRSIVRHRCAAPISDGLRRLADDAAAANLRSLLGPFVRHDAVQTLLQRRRIVAVAESLGAAGVAFALLKGSAQTFRDDAASVHPSIDIDLFVPRAAVLAAVATLRRAGYGFRSDDATQLRYVETHHHIAPLYPSVPGPSIEVHTALAPPGTLGLRTDWEALKSHLVEVETADGKARCFDSYGTALHYAIHAIGFARLRDVFSCAQALRELDERQRAELHRLASTDSIDPVRFGASLVLASRLAALPAPSAADAERYIDWAARRDDMPRALRARCWGVEAWFVAGRRWRLDKRTLTLDHPTAQQVAGRIALVPLALAYAEAMHG